MKEALKLALEALKSMKETLLEHDMTTTFNEDQAISALKEALAQDALQALHDENERLGLYEQEPVAWMDADGNMSDNNDHKCFPIPLYTTPQRTWVELTRGEIEAWKLPVEPTVAEFAWFIEAKLKEKNT